MNNRDQIRFVILIPTPFFVNLWEKLNNSERFPNLYTDSFRPIVILLFPTQKKTTIVGNADEMQSPESAGQREFYLILSPVSSLSAVHDEDEPASSLRTDAVLALLGAKQPAALGSAFRRAAEAAAKVS